MRNVFIMWAVLGVACGVLAMIPFFFWDLTEKKQLEMARELKIRAMQNKLEDNEFTQDDVKEAMELGVVTAGQVSDMGLIPSAENDSDVAEAAADAVADKAD